MFIARRNIGPSLQIRDLNPVPLFQWAWKWVMPSEPWAPWKSSGDCRAVNNNTFAAACISIWRVGRDDSISPCSPGQPGTCYGNQAGIEPTESTCLSFWVLGFKACTTMPGHRCYFYCWTALPWISLICLTSHQLMAVWVSSLGYHEWKCVEHSSTSRWVDICFYFFWINM